jgi:hypothetical protein
MGLRESCIHSDSISLEDRYGCLAPEARTASRRTVSSDVSRVRSGLTPLILSGGTGRANGLSAPPVIHGRFKKGCRIANS